MSGMLVNVFSSIRAAIRSLLADLEREFKSVASRNVS